MSLRYQLTQCCISEDMPNTSAKVARRACRLFANFCAEQGFNKLDKINAAGARQVLQEYADTLVAAGYAPATIHTYLAAPCKALGVSMRDICKPKRTCDHITRSRDESRNIQGQAELGKERYARVVDLQKAIGIRRSELGRLRGRNLIRDESGYLCVEVERGKGGKRQLQRILPQHLPTVEAIFAATEQDSYVFSSTELRNKIDLHAIRGEVAREAYAYYEALPFSEKKKVFRELKLRWLTDHPHHDESGAAYQRWLSQFTTGHGLYALRGANYDRAVAAGRPTKYSRFALMAVSMFHLSHYRLNVTVISYML